jgi:hypothetical protein
MEGAWVYYVEVGAPTLDEFFLAKTGPTVGGAATGEEEAPFR